MEKISKILALIGVLIVVVGFVLNDILIDFTAYFNILMVLGVSTFVFFILCNFNILKVFSKKKTTRYGATSVLGTLIFVSILIVINMIAHYRWTKIDFTRESRHSLPSTTVNILENLQNDVTITSFLSKGTEFQKKMSVFINKFSEYTDKITIVHVDPNVDTIMVRKYNIPFQTIVFESGDRSYRIELDISTEVKKEDTIAKVRNIHSLITNAVNRVSKAKKKKVYFLAGHGENSLYDKTGAGASNIINHLTKMNYVVDSVSLLKGKKVLDDCDVLVILNPKKPFLKEELAILDDYIVRNGKMAIFVDTDTHYDIIKFLDKYGLHVNTDIIIDKTIALQKGDYTTPLITKEGYNQKHNITKGFRESIFLLGARSIAFTKEFQPWQKYVYLAKTQRYPVSWAETNVMDLKNAVLDQGVDIPGPVQVAGIFTYDAALAKGDRQVTPEGDEDVSQIALFGDSDFITNRRFNYSGNATLFSNTINFLAREMDLISVETPAAIGSTIILSETDKALLNYFSIYIFPTIVFITGIVVWLRRRNL